MAGALVVGAGAASGALWYYSRRYVGELALLPSGAPGQPPRLRLSVLDFWGNREVRGWGVCGGDAAGIHAGGSVATLAPVHSAIPLPGPQDNVVALQALVPPLEHLPTQAARRAALGDPLLPVDVAGDRQYFLR